MAHEGEGLGNNEPCKMVLRRAARLEGHRSQLRRPMPEARAALCRRDPYDRMIWRRCFREDALGGARSFSISSSSEEDVSSCGHGALCR